MDYVRAHIYVVLSAALYSLKSCAEEKVVWQRIGGFPPVVVRVLGRFSFISMFLVYLYVTLT